MSGHPIPDPKDPTPGERDPDFDPTVQYRGTEVDADAVADVEAVNPTEGEPDPDGVVQYRGSELADDEGDAPDDE